LAGGFHLRQGWGGQIVARLLRITAAMRLACARPSAKIPARMLPPFFSLDAQTGASAKPLPLLGFGRQLGRGLDHFFQDFAEFLQASRGYDHIVTASIDVLGNAQEAAPRIFLQGENKGLPFDLNLFRF
jgi:hypothetical protein